MLKIFPLSFTMLNAFSTQVLNISNTRYLFSSELDDGSSTGSDTEESNSEQINEANILLGISRHLLPKIGKGVKTLVLECSKAITNGLVSNCDVFFCQLNLTESHFQDKSQSLQP